MVLVRNKLFICDAVLERPALKPRVKKASTSTAAHSTRCWRQTLGEKEAEISAMGLWSSAIGVRNGLYACKLCACSTICSQCSQHVTQHAGFLVPQSFLTSSCTGRGQKTPSAACTSQTIKMQRTQKCSMLTIISARPTQVLAH